METTNNENNEKKITINGTNNRYQIKKLTQNRESKKKRCEISSLNLKPDDLSFLKQLEIIENIHSQSTEKKALQDKMIKLAISQIERKINSYKHQDIEKNILDTDNFIKFNQVIQKLIDCELLCYYCKREMYILYEFVRENSQWSLDRIDNDIGHNNDNVLISCLECNLKRRKQNKDKFLYTKNLKIIKSD